MIAAERGASVDADAILAAVDALAPAFADSGLDELEVEVGDISVRMARPSAVSTAPVAPAATVAAVPEARPPAAPVTPYGEAAPGMRFVTAPLTGVWYTAPSPDARPYVQAGGQVGAGQVIGLIEAMKLFNEIKSDVAGTVSRVLAENGTLVKRQQPLLEIRP